jgi:hypothetical protein
LSKKKKVEEQLEAILKLLMLVETHLKLVHKDMELKFSENALKSVEQMRDLVEAHIKELEVDAVRRKKEERRSFQQVYYSIFLSAVIGVMGNTFVSLMFQEWTFLTLMTLVMVGAVLAKSLYDIWKGLVKA